jgi:hypothetical protein
MTVPSQGVTKRCRLSWLAISALVLYEHKCVVGGELRAPQCGVSANEFSCTHEPK